ncbi:MAG: hypothetical protein ACE5E8_00315 [Acidimicrobiia bacterium]
MDDFPSRIADFLEQMAAKVRALTVDRLARVIKWVSLGCVVAILALIAVIFLLVGGFRALGEAIGVTAAYGALGGLFVLVGVFLWSKRHTRTEEKP